jgi:hypothetical protein
MSMGIWMLGGLWLAVHRRHPEAFEVALLLDMMDLAESA